MVELKIHSWEFAGTTFPMEFSVFGHATDDFIHEFPCGMNVGSIYKFNLKNTAGDCLDSIPEGTFLSVDVGVDPDAREENWFYNLIQVSELSVTGAGGAGYFHADWNNHCGTLGTNGEDRGGYRHCVTFGQRYFYTMEKMEYYIPDPVIPEAYWPVTRHTKPGWS